MSLNIEEEINFNLLQGNPPAFIAELLYEKVNALESELDENNLNSFLFFLIKSGRFDLLLFYFQKNILNVKWHLNRAYLIHALTKSYPDFEEDLKIITIESLNKKNDESIWIEASIAKVADKNFPDFKIYRKKIKEQSQKNYAKKRNDLLQKFSLFKSQQLIEAAKKILKQLEKTFPMDNEIKDLVRENVEIDANAIFDKYKFKEKSIFQKPKNEPAVEIVKLNLEKNLLTDVFKYQENYQDLVILCLFIESYSTALSLIMNFKNEIKTVWLLIEVLIKNHRYLEVLNILPVVEKTLSNDSETFFATTYYRAICFWNLGEKSNAIEVMESLIGVKPNYRDSEILNEEWRKF